MELLTAWSNQIHRLVFLNCVTRFCGRRFDLRKDNTRFSTAIILIPMMNTHPADHRSAKRPADNWKLGKDEVRVECQYEGDR